MCGRFALLSDLSVIVESFGIDDVEWEFNPSDNISPGQPIATVVCDAKKKRLIPLRWGLVPSWAEDPSIGNVLFNARAETLTEKPSFRNAYKRRRCLIVANGFYEWKTDVNKKEKVRFYFHLRSEKPFGLAGLYETWNHPQEKSIKTCTIITTTANELVRPVHDRMPVIIPKDKESLWLDPSRQNHEELQPLLKPYPAYDMRGVRS